MTTAFTSCRVTSDGDTTQNLNLNSHTPFEAQNALSITVSDDALEIEEYPPVFAAGNGSLLAIACGQIVHIVSILGAPKSKVVKQMDALVSGLNFFQKGRILIIVLVDGTLSFCNFCEDKPQFHDKRLLPPVVIGCGLELADGTHKEYIKVSVPDGRLFVLQLDNYDDILAAGVSIIEKQTQVLLKSCAVVSESNVLSDLVSIFDDQLISFPRTSGASVGFDVHDLSQYDVFCENKQGFAKVVNVGCSTYALTTDGLLYLYNNTLGMIVASFDLRDDKSFDDIFTGFNLIQTQNNEDFTPSIVLSVYNPDRDNHEIQIRNYPYTTIQYRLNTSPNVCIMPNMSTGDDIMVLVEPFHGKHYDEVLVRYVFEAHPQMRLDKLLLRCRFDDAENIAKRYNLDVEKIHIARVLDMLNHFGTNALENSVLMDKLKPYLDQITDHNEVGDLCVHAVTVVPAYPIILTFLEYAATRNIDDLETKRQLSQFSYDLATFSIIGDCDNHFDPTLWKRFVGTSDEVLTLFESLWATQQPAAARIIWARYKARICQFYSEENQRVFDLIELLQGTTDCFTEVVEFIESELGVFYLEVDDLEVMKARGRVLIDFCLAASNALERFEPTEFPANALNVCGIVDRLFEHMVNVKLTPYGIEHIYKLFFSLGMGVDKDASPLGSLKIKHANLKKMVDLKVKYGLNVTYNKFTELNETSICFLLLEKTLTTNVFSYIKKVIIPYMNEYNLQKDQTLLDYVIEISNKRSTADITVTSPLQNVALEIASCIENPSFRCRAIIEQARQSMFPWSANLTRTVETMLQNKDVSSSLIHDLKNQCRRAELGSYLLRYDIPVSLLRNIISSTAKNVIKAIACKSGVAMKIRINNAVIVFNLFREVFEFFLNETAENLIYTLVIRHTMEISEWSLKELQTIILSIPSPELRQSQIKTAIGYCTALLNGKNPDIREQATTSALMLIRLSDAEHEYVDVKRNVQCLQALLKTFKVTVMYNVLTERSKTAAKKLILDFTLDSTSTVGRIFSFGSLLGLGPMEIGATLLEELIITAPISMLVLVIKEMCQKSSIDKSGVVLIVQGLQAITKRMQEVAEDTDFEVESAFELAAILSEMNCLASVVDAAARFGIPQTETLVTLCSYLSLCDHVLGALVNENQKTAPGDDDGSKFVKFDFQSLSNQFPTVKTADFGLLYDYTVVIRQIVRLASMCFIETPKLDVSDVALHDVVDELQYALSSNPLITFIATTTIARFPCFKNTLNPTNNDAIIRSIYQKLITESQIDLYTCLLLTVHCKNEEIISLLNELLVWATKSQNANAVYYLAFVMQVVSICTNNYSNATAIIKSFRSALWVRRFTKEKLSIRNVEDHKLVRDDLLDAVCPALLYLQYLVDMDESVNENLIKYGSGLLRRSNDCPDVARSEKMRAFAKQAFMLVSREPNEWAFAFGQETMMALCSYAYESLEVLLEQLEVWATTEAQLMAIQQQKKWLKLLKRIGRSYGVTASEMQWFTMHQRANAMMDDSMMDVDVDTSFNYEKPDSDEPLSVKLPPIAAKRLPFHIFLEEQHDKLRKDIVGNELTLANSDNWQSLVRDLNSNLLSRAKVVGWAILNRLREVVALQADLSPADAEAFHTTLSGFSDNRKDGLIHYLAVETKKTTLCPAKVKAFEILETVCTEWLKKGISDPKEKMKIMDCRIHLVRYWRRFQCELHFFNCGIKGVDTIITSSENNAILHIFTERTNWSDRNDIHQKMRLARDVAAVFNTTLAETFGQIIDKWLAGGDDIAGFLQPIMTTNLTGLTVNATTSGRNLVPPLPYNDIEVIRIAYMLTELVKQSRGDPRINAEQYIMKIAVCLHGDNVSYELLAKKLKILCVFMQALDSAGFNRFFNSNIACFADQMKTMILFFIFKTCSVEIPTSEYSTFDAVVLVQSFLSGRGGMRNPSHIAQLATVTIVDRKVADIPTIERTFKLLMSSHRNGPYIKMLLQHTATFENAYSMKTLPSAFAETFKNEWYSLGKEGENRLYRKAVYDILGCPVEAKYAFSQVIAELCRSKMPNAVEMIARVSGLTSDDIVKFCGGIKIKSQEASLMDVLPRIGSLLTALNGVMTTESTVFANVTVDDMNAKVKMEESADDAKNIIDIEMDDV